MNLVAVENETEVASAVAELVTKFSAGADTTYPKSIWRPELGVCARFSRLSRTSDQRTYYNVFATSRERFEDHIVVEINPPRHGHNAQYQGMVARDANGHIWLAHRGGLATRRARITKEQFLQATRSHTATVTFSDSSTAKCALVCRLTYPSEKVQSDIADFVYDCKRIRRQKEDSSSIVRVYDAVDAFEGRFTPESAQSYLLPPRDAKGVEKFHAQIVYRLAEILRSLKIDNSNDRVGRYGPDLYAAGPPSVLFEVKSNKSAGSVQQAI